MRWRTARYHLSLFVALFGANIYETKLKPEKRNGRKSMVDDESSFIKIRPQ